MAKVTVDKYANVAFGHVIASAANTLTFNAIQMMVGLFQGVGMILHRILYVPSTATVRELVDATDLLQMAVTTSQRLTALYEISDAAIVDVKTIIGVGVTTGIITVPLITDLTSLPGGGRILPTNPLYLGIQTAGAVAGSDFRAQLDFTFVDLSDKDYIELIQAQLPANV